MKKLTTLLAIGFAAIVPSAVSAIIPINIGTVGISGINAGLSSGGLDMESMGSLGVILTANGGGNWVGLGGTTGLTFAGLGGPATPKRFTSNSTIDASSAYYDYSTEESWFRASSFTSPDFNSGSYMGFTTATGNFGWFEVTWSSFSNQFQIYSGAYETVAGVAILAGDTVGGGGPSSVPEPGQVAASLLLLVGIGGYVFLKRRKAANAAAPTAA